MAKFLLKKSYLLKNLKEIPFNDLWGSKGVFTTMRLVGNKNKIVLKNNHINNLITSAKKYKIKKKKSKKNNNIYNISKLRTKLQKSSFKNSFR